MHLYPLAAQRCLLSKHHPVSLSSDQLRAEFPRRDLGPWQAKDNHSPLPPSRKFDAVTRPYHRKRTVFRNTPRCLGSGLRAYLGNASTTLPTLSAPFFSQAAPFIGTSHRGAQEAAWIWGVAQIRAPAIFILPTPRTCSNTAPDNLSPLLRHIAKRVRRRHRIWGSGIALTHHVAGALVRALESFLHFSTTWNRCLGIHTAKDAPDQATLSAHAGWLRAFAHCKKKPR